MNNNITLISLKEYADLHKVDTSTLRHKIINGKLKAIKKGRDWLIDRNEPYIDHRKKTTD